MFIYTVYEFYVVTNMERNAEGVLKQRINQDREASCQKW